MIKEGRATAYTPHTMIASLRRTLFLPLLAAAAFAADPVPMAEVEGQPLAANAEAVVQEGKIKSFSSILTDEAQARLEAAQPAADTASTPTQEVAAPAQDAATQEAATPAQLPSTGGASAPALRLSVILAIAGGLLLVVGLGLKRLRGTA